MVFHKKSLIPMSFIVIAICAMQVYLLLDNAVIELLQSKFLYN
jgi:hypothetical protein